MPSGHNRSRRRFLQGTAASALVLAPPVPAVAESSVDALPPAFSGLKPLGARVHPILADDFRDRLSRAQQLMSEVPPPAAPHSPAAKYDALFLAPGTSLYYFTGIRWSLSERLLGLVVPRTGQPILVVPAFEESRLREKLRFPLEVRVWQEDESPTRVAASALADRGIRAGLIGVEETTAFTFFDHFREAAPGFQYVSADPLTIACRAHKSAHELDLMRLACEATFDVFRATFASLKEGMSQEDIAHLIEAGFAKMGLHGCRWPLPCLPL